MTASDFFFSATCVTDVAPGSALTLAVHNSGLAIHNVTVPGQNIDEDLQPGQTITITVKVGTTTLGFYCKYHRSSGMVGAVIPS
jgi:plastocyanin